MQGLLSAAVPIPSASADGLGMWVLRLQVDVSCMTAASIVGFFSIRGGSDEPDLPMDGRLDVILQSAKQSVSEVPGGGRILKTRLPLTSQGLPSRLSILFPPLSRNHPGRLFLTKLTDVLVSPRNMAKDFESRVACWIMDLLGLGRLGSQGQAVDDFAAQGKHHVARAEEPSAAVAKTHNPPVSTHTPPLSTVTCQQGETRLTWG